MSRFTSFRHLAGFRQYGIPILAVLVAALLRVVLEPLWGARLPFFTFYPAVMLSAWCCGFRAGVLATAGSIGVIDYLWLGEVFDVAGRREPGEIVALGLFALVGVAISGACEAAHRYHRRLKATAAAERRLLQERMALLECAAQGLFGVDRDGRCTFINRACADMLGWSPGEVLGRDMHALLHPRRPDGRPSPREECAIYRAVELGTAAFVTDELVWRRDGTSFPAEYAAQPLVVDGQVVGSIVALADLTQRRRTEAEIGRLLDAERAARAEAEGANKAKDEFLAVLSHELRTPLTAMLGWIALLRPGRLPAERTRYALEVIERNARMQAQLINDLLDVSRIVAGKMELNRLPVDLAGVVLRAVESAQREAEAKRIRVITTVDPAAGPVLGDATRLEQITGNILANAIKFTPSEGAIAVTLDRHRGRARLRVSDSGPGIAPDVLPHVFERFRQAESSSRRRHEGLGLGLAIVRHLVETHGGIVRAENNPEGGATFTAELPVLTARSHGIAAKPDAAAPAASVRLDGLAVLLVEDHADSRETIALTLEGFGASVTAVPAVADALAVLRDRPVDLLVSDLGMPGADGFDLIRRIRWQEDRLGRSRLPAIALTAYASAEDRERTLAAGYDAHVAKPVDSDELGTALVRLAPRSRV